MKVTLFGAFGHLGTDILKALLDEGHEVTAVDMITRELPGYEGKFKAVAADVTSPGALKGTCDGADVVITTVGLTKTSAELTNYDVDYAGNIAILKEAESAGVKHFNYISVIGADKAPDVPMLDAKAKVEDEIRKSGISYVIYRPTGYFYDIAHIFQPMIEKGKVSLLKDGSCRANVVDTPDFGRYITAHMTDDNKMYEVGGSETYSYTELAHMFADAAGKKIKISYAPVFLFDILIKVNKRKKNGKDAIIKFSKWTLTHDLIGSDIAGKTSFKEYVYSLYNGKDTQ